MHRLKEKVALVTGAASGIGEAIVRAFVEEGAFVYLADIDSCGQLVADSLGSAAVFEKFDVAEETQWKQLTEKIIQQKGVLDVVVNNAGITGLEAIEYLNGAFPPCATITIIPSEPPQVDGSLVIIFVITPASGAVNTTGLFG